MHIYAFNFKQQDGTGTHLLYQHEEKYSSEELVKILDDVLLEVASKNISDIGKMATERFVRGFDFYLFTLFYSEAVEKGLVKRGFTKAPVTEAFLPVAGTDVFAGPIRERTDRARVRRFRAALAVKCPSFVKKIVELYTK